MTTVAIIVAGGTGERFGAPGGKQLAKVAGRPMLSWTVDAFDACPDVDSIVIAGDPDRLGEFAKVARSKKVTALVGGGVTRTESVAAGLAEVPTDADVIAVHDGARPLVTPETISDAVRALLADPGLAGVVIGHPVYDTVKRAEVESAGDMPVGLVRSTVDRTSLWQAQTPQVFRAEPLRAAYAKPRGRRSAVTDDASLVERAGGRVMMVRGPRENVKVTVPEDLLVVEAVLKARRKGLA